MGKDIKDKAVAKAKKVAKSNKKGENKKKFKIHTQIRFYRPKTLIKSRSPKAPRFVRDALRVAKK